MIKISVENVETMAPMALRRIAGLFEVMADYAASDANAAGVAPHAQKSRDEEMQRELQEKIKAEMLHVAQKTTRPQEAVSEAIIHNLGATEPDQSAPAWPFTPPAQEAGIDVDSQGMPWDGRIHASSRAKVGDGTWRKKRGVDELEIALIENELRETMGGLVAAPAPVQVPPPPFVASVAPPAVPINITPVPTPVGAAAIASTSDLFPKLMKGITAAYSSKTLSQDAINAALSSVGVPALPMLLHRQDLIPMVAISLGIAL